MENFLLLIREDLKELELMSGEQMDKEILEMTKWVEGLAQSGNFASGEPLLSSGRYIHNDKVLSDGPFIEAKEAISGYIFIKAENIDQATSIAQTCPILSQKKMAIEVRPIMEYNL